MAVSSLHVLHISTYRYLPPSQTFVHARVLNPICQRPVPVIADSVYAPYEQEQAIAFYPGETVKDLNDPVDSLIYGDFCSSLHAYEVIRKLRPQLIHMHFGHAAASCLSIAQHFNIPTVVNFYGLETKLDIHNPAWLRRYQIVYAQADAFICSSDMMKVSMIETGCPSDKISVIRCGVDTAFFDGDVRPWATGQPLHLLSIARLHPEKGLNYLLDAGHLLNNSGFSNWQLQIIGEGHIEAELKAQSKEYGLQEQVSFLGTRTPAEVRDALRAAHLMILPSIQETQGIVVQEAQATRTPVIASNAGGIPEGVSDGQGGFLVEPKSPTAIVEKINQFLDNPALFVQMGHAGRQYVVDRFSRDEEYRQISMLYRSLV